MWAVKFKVTGIKIMKPQHIAKAYDHLVHLWQNNSFDMSNGIEQHKRAINFVDNRNRALDVGCGCTGRFF